MRIFHNFPFFLNGFQYDNVMLCLAAIKVKRLCRIWHTDMTWSQKYYLDNWNGLNGYWKHTCVLTTLSCWSLRAISSSDNPNCLSSSKCWPSATKRLNSDGIIRPASWSVGMLYTVPIVNCFTLDNWLQDKQTINIDIWCTLYVQEIRHHIGWLIIIIITIIASEEINSACKSQPNK